MDITHEYVDKIRNNIASIVYNDGLPTNYITNGLKAICSNYNDYRNNEDTVIKAQSLTKIKNNVGRINDMNKATGSSSNILYLKDDCEESLKNMGEAIATLYEIPYITNINIDYVGYAYGTMLPRYRMPSAYKTYKPDQYLNDCNQAILQNNINNNAYNQACDIWNYMMDNVSTYHCILEIQRGEQYGNQENAKNVMKANIKRIDNVVATLTDEPYHIDTRASAYTTALCVSYGMRFGTPTAIEQLRCKGLFRNSTEHDLEYLDI